MLLSQQNKKTIDACRFCWMCRHICPIGNVTGEERNNARARALSLSMVERGTPLSVDSMENVYECALCGACTHDCATGFDPVQFTKAVRLEGMQDGVTPKAVVALIEKIETFGNPYGTERDITLIDTINGLPNSSDTLLFLGTDTRYKSAKSGLGAIKLMQKAKVDFTVLSDEPDSGYHLDTLIGKAEETRQKMLNCANVLNQFKEIIVYDPADAKVFLREYKEWGIALPTITTFTYYIETLLKNGNFHLKKSELSFVPQDSCLLARDLEEIDPIRHILDTCGNRKEMLLYGKETVWAGNLIMKEFLPRIVEKTAKARWKNALSTGADVLVTESPSEYEVLLAVKPEDMQLMSLEEAVLGVLESC
jgi:Fe-S oxidoreductase